MTKHFRAPIFDTLRDRSPFESLSVHAAKITECMAALDGTIAAFVSGDHPAVLEGATKVSAIELEADHLKSNIRNHLPGNIRMPVPTALFLATLHEQDNILDEAEDAAMWMSMRQTKVPAAVGDGLHKLFREVQATIEAYEEAVANLSDLVHTGFVRRERDEEKELVQRVHELEHQTDVTSRELSRQLLAPEAEAELGAVAVYHLLKLTLQISKIADHAENAGDRIRAMLAR